MLVDVLQSRNSFMLQTSVRLSMNYTLLTTERNGAKLEFENFTYTKKRENENTQITTWRCTDRRCKGTGKTIEGSFEFLLTNPHYHEANPAKKELVQIEKAIESRAVQSLEPPRVVVQMSTNNSTGEAVAQMPHQRTMVRRIQRRRVVAHIPNPLSTSVLNVPDDLRTTIRGEPFYAFDSGKEDPNRFIIFTTQKLDELEFSAKWAVDGTFAVCPSLFYQLYTMHGIIKDTTVPLVYCLMRNKTKEKYEEYVHPTIFKFIDFLRREKSAAENKLISLQAGKEFPKNARYQKNALRIKNILEGYQNNRIEPALNGLSNNFDLV